MIRTLLSPERTDGRRRGSALGLIGLLLLPPLLGGLLAWAWNNPAGELQNLTAAIVNLDKGATVDGSPAPLGRQLAAGLVDAEGDSSVDWVLSNASDAAAGLDEGRYQAVITIPETFSVDALSAGTALSGGTDNPVRTRIGVTTSPEAGVIDGILAQQLATTAAQTFNATLSEATLSKVFTGFTTLSDQLGTAAKGASDLAGGAKDAADGTTQLADGATSLADGTTALGTGVIGLRDGANGLASGARQTAQGARDLSGGASAVAGGAAQSADGARALANGLRTGAQTAANTPIVPSELSDAANGAAQAATGVSDGIAALSAQCAGSGAAEAFCASLAQLGGPAGAAAQASVGTRDGLAALAGAVPGALSAQLSGAADSADQLAAGLDGVRSGAQQVSDGATGLAGGAGQLADGAAQLASGAERVAGGMAPLTDGATGLADGLSDLATGIGSLSDGASSLSTGLTTAADAVPRYTDDQASALAVAAAAPVRTDGMEGTLLGTAAVPLLIAVVLWFGALASFVLLRGVTARLVASSRPVIILVLRALAPGALLGALQGLAVAGIVQIVTGGAGDQFAGLLAVSALVGVSFAAVQQALLTVLGGTGRWLAALAGAVTIAAGVVSTVPGALTSLAAMLPLDAARAALLPLTTDADGLGSAITALVVWAVLSIAASTVAVAVRRSRAAVAEVAVA